MLYLLDKDAKTVKWNGIPLHEASSAIVKEETNGDFVLTVHYPITDSGVYQLIKEDMLIKAPVPVLGAQLFRIKKPVENDDSLDITAYHITDDVMQRSITPMSVVGQGCAMALSQMVQNAKTGLGDFSFTSDIMDSRTFNTTETETLYSVLLDGKHSIVGTWEGELVRDNFALSIKRSRGADRGVVITTHKNLKSYQRTKNSQNVVTRIHARSTFRAEGAETDTVLTVTVDSPLIGNYPYINEKEYENNDVKTIDELKKWAEAKFKNDSIDKVSDAIEIEAYELDGQVVHLGDTVNIKSSKHSVDIYKKAIAYEYNALTEEYISITFDDKPGVGGSGVSSGMSNAADVILSANRNAQEVAIGRAVKNANQAFDAEFEKQKIAIEDGIEQAKAEAELYADNIKQSIDAEVNAINQSMQAQSDEHDRQVADILSKTQSVEELASQAKTDAASAIAEAIRLDTVERQATETKLATAKSQAIAEANVLVETAKSLLSGQVSSVSTDLSQTKEAIKLLATKATVDALTGRISSAESTLQVQAGEIASRVKSSDFDQAKQRISTAESSITQLGNLISTEISETVAKIPTSVGGQNLIRNGGFPTNTQYWSGSMIVSQHGFYYSGQKKLFSLQTEGTAEITASSNRFEVKRNTNYTLSFYAFAGPNVRNSDVYFLGRKSNETNNFTFINPIIYERRFRGSPEYITVTFNSGDNDSGFIRFDNNGSTDGVNAVLFFGEVMLVEGTVARTYEPSPEEVTDEVKSVKTTITQTASGVEQLSTSLATTDGKVTTAETKINQLISDVSSKVSQTDYNTLTGRVSSAETAITQNATEISKRLTSTQVESAITGKGYQTKSDVDSNITGRGYITSSALQPYALSTTVQNLVKETADSFSRTISETKALIPTDFSGGNLIRNSGFPTNTQYWSGSMIVSQHGLYYSGQKKLFSLQTEGTAEITASSNRFEVKRNTNYTLSFYAFAGPNVRNSDVYFLGRKSNETNDFTYANAIIDSRIFSGSKAEYVTVTFNSSDSDNGYIRFDNNGSTNGANAVLFFGEVMLVEGTTPRKWEACLDDFATVTALHSVRDTVDSHTRTIGAVGTSGSILDNVSKVTQTANGLVTEVSGANGLKTQVSTLAGSYAIKSLTKAGDVLGQINLNKDGSIKLDGSLVQITGKTYIQDGIISSAKIANLDAGKITTGTLDAARIATNSITGSHIAFDQAFFNKFTTNEAYLKQIFAKNAFITQVQSVTMSASQISGGVLKALNNAMEINMNAGQVLYYTENAALKRVLNGYPTQFVKFATGTVTGKGNAGVTVIGSNRYGTESTNDGGFVGIRAWNSSNVDTLDLVGDDIRLASSAYENPAGWNVNTLPSKLSIDAHNTGDRPSSRLSIGDVQLFRNASDYVSLMDVLQQFNRNFKHLINITGRGDVILTWDTIK